jgi:hypothetical protein
MINTLVSGAQFFVVPPAGEAPQWKASLSRGNAGFLWSKSPSFWCD